MHATVRFWAVWLGVIGVLLGTFRCTPANVIPTPKVLPSLPVPKASPAGSTQAYGTTVKLQIDSLPAQTTIEFSTDDGRTWVAGREVILKQTMVLRVRSRQREYVSPDRTEHYTVAYKRVLFAGNSITLHPPLPEAGWTGNWGMAASAPEKDYVHIVTRYLQGLDPNVEVRAYNFAGFEANYWRYDYRFLRDVAVFKPDLLIVRIGENVPTDSLISRNFAKAYGQFIDSLTVLSPRVKVVCSSTFWDQYQTSQLMKQVATQRFYPFADLNPLVNVKSYQALNRFSNADVGKHPGDSGMQAIADLIWEKIQ